MSLFRRSPPRARTTPAPPTDTALPVQEVTLLVTSEHGREALIARAERSLGEDEVLVRVRDLVGERRSFCTIPLDKRATLVAKEPLTVLRGSLTALVAYYRVPADGLDAREEHYEEGEFSHAYDVKLSVLGRGRTQTQKKPVVA